MITARVLYPRCHFRLQSAMRLGGPVPWDGDVEAHVRMAQERGYRALYTPWETGELDSALCQRFAAAAAQAGMIIAETSAWSNPMHPDTDYAAQRLQYCCERLATAEELGARCCVNIAGSSGAGSVIDGNEIGWMGPHPNDLSEASFERLVSVIRQIIDAVKPQRTVYSIETMPWMHPDSVQAYARLLDAVDRKAFGVHFDPVNLLNSPRTTWNNSQLIDDAFRLLGPRIASCHAKDIRLRPQLTVHLDEVPAGTGLLDYPHFLQVAHAADPDMPLMLEHLDSDQAYKESAERLHSIANNCGVPL